MTTVRIGASMAKNVQEVINWLDQNVSTFKCREMTDNGIWYHGVTWAARWRQFGSGWFMDITFDDPKYASFFTLRWK